MSAGPFVRMVAFRYLRARRQEGFISVNALFSFLGIALGVAALIITMSVMNGFAEDLLGRIVGLGGHITLAAESGPLADYGKIADTIDKLPGIIAVRPTVEGQVLVAAGGGAKGAAVRGLRPNDLAAEGQIASHLVAGDVKAFTGDSVLIGARLALGLGVRPGDRVTLTTPNVTGGSFSMPRARSYQVAGIFSVGIPEYDSGFLFMPLATAQDYFGMKGGVTSLEIFVRDPDAVATYEHEVRAAVAGTFHLTSWQQSNSALFGALQVERIAMFVILSLIVLVAAFNIISGMIMLVTDKGRDIAVLRTMGATQGMILRTFMLSGASIGVAGTIAGLALGIAGAANLQNIQAAAQRLTGINALTQSLDFFSRVPALIDPRQVALVAAMAFGVSFLATVYPSWRAARLDPVEALRYE